MKTEPASILTSRIKMLFSREISLGITLLLMVILAMAWANSPWSDLYHGLWKTRLTIGFDDFKITESLHRWINDGLMAYFFFLIGLEVKREFISGALSTPKKAALPLVAAIGGMLLPAVIYLSLNWDGPGASGWGIPMATDIAFAVGLLTLAGAHIGQPSRTFLKAVATADDIAVILIIAFFLSSGVEPSNLVVGGVYFGVMVAGNLLGVRSFWFYLILGTLGLWVALLLSGIHATLAGFLTALTIPARTSLTERSFRERMLKHIRAFNQTLFTGGPFLSRKQVDLIKEIIYDSKQALPPLQRVEDNIRPFVHFGVLPLFALSNAGVTIEGDLWGMLMHPVSLGVIAGLVLGKFGGIFLISRALLATGLGELPKHSNWKQIAGLGFMAGIGFTMSLFIAELALDNAYLVEVAKLGILAGSLISGVLGIVWLRGLRK
ncbi:MAG: Na+/H+ antiporter NhaA [Robiginitalea sp.]|jgi:NhaA family Na+:H+ antiporter